MLLALSDLMQNLRNNFPVWVQSILRYRCESW